MEALCPPGLYLTGSAYRGVGIPDCVKQGQATAAQVTQYLQARPDFSKGMKPHSVGDAATEDCPLSAV
jgi:heterodisulfide reductase subunit A-like polyferredoxin